MKHAAIALFSAVLGTTATAQTNCKILEDVAATSYKRANEALAKGWQEAANSAAYFFWYVHDLGDCNLTKAMATQMTKAGLSKGTQPVGPAPSSSSKILVSIPSDTQYAANTGSSAQGVIAPEALVVNGAIYKLWTNPSSVTVSKKSIDDLLADTSQTKLNGIAVDKELLRQWKTVPTSPAFEGNPLKKYRMAE